VAKVTKEQFEISIERLKAMHRKVTGPKVRNLYMGFCYLPSGLVGIGKGFKGVYAAARNCIETHKVEACCVKCVRIDQDGEITILSDLGWNNGKEWCDDPRPKPAPEPPTITEGYWYVRYDAEPGYFIAEVVPNEMKAQLEEAQTGKTVERELLVYIHDEEGPCSIEDVGAEKFICKVPPPPFLGVKDID